ncbi:hypothetical protein Pth03_12250 [Planotetraspora thailandica]|uniref:Uncharacterized protein n=1 Tax=Planotetraspora thailandica TaxID=487172 RepID=A0A8J3XUN4_9ACTN|nr:hypothetical protein [Planotetraspora thailandica]GII52836.1 hypothetical protein Pth03_12250 [Planotetraspora thailandica]
MNDRDLYELVAKAAEHLDGFEPLIRPGHPAYLVGTGGARLVVHRLWNRAGRIRVQGVYPDGIRGLLPDLPRHEITVLSAWGAKFVAKKIERRLLPGYRRDLASCQDRLVSREAETHARTELTKTLLAMLPGATLTEKQRETVIRWRLGEASGSFVLHGAALDNSIEIRRADRELTERVAYAIQQRSI